MTQITNGERGKTVACFGEVLMRFTPSPQELFFQSPQMRVGFAGAEANVAVALSSFGRRTQMITTLPDTVIGHAALTALRGFGVGVERVRFAPGRMGLFFLSPGAMHRPSEVLYDRASSAFAQCPEFESKSAFAGVDWFHVSGITPALTEACARSAILAMRTANELGVSVSFDGNYRSKLWGDRRQAAPELLRQMLDCADVFFGDDRDIALITGKVFRQTDGAERRLRAAQTAFEQYPRLNRMACTVRNIHSTLDHDLAASMFTRSGTHHVAPLRLSGIVDRVGAGDAFAAGLIHSILAQVPDPNALSFGLAAAAIKHSIPGDFLTLSESAIRQAMDADRTDIKR